MSLPAGRASLYTEIPIRSFSRRRSAGFEHVAVDGQRRTLAPAVQAAPGKAGRAPPIGGRPVLPRAEV